jgi:hypothetical protein
MLQRAVRRRKWPRRWHVLTDEPRAQLGCLRLAGERQVASGTVLDLTGGLEESIGLSAQFARQFARHARQLVTQLGYLAAEFGNLGGLLGGVTADNLVDNFLDNACGLVA